MSASFTRLSSDEMQMVPCLECYCCIHPDIFLPVQHHGTGVSRHIEHWAGALSFISDPSKSYQYCWVEVSKVCVLRNTNRFRIKNLLVPSSALIGKVYDGWYRVAIESAFRIRMYFPFIASCQTDFRGKVKAQSKKNHQRVAIERSHLTKVAPHRGATLGTRIDHQGWTGNRKFGNLPLVEIARALKGCVTIETPMRDVLGICPL